MHYLEYYTRIPRKREPLKYDISLNFPRKILTQNNTGQVSLPGADAVFYLLWKITPVTDTLTQATCSPLVFPTALMMASCTARATVGTA